MVPALTESLPETIGLYVTEQLTIDEAAAREDRTREEMAALLRDWKVPIRDAEPPLNGSLDLEDALDWYKANGASFLVHGDVPIPDRAEFSSNMLGDVDRDRQRLLLVLDDAVEDLDAHLPGPLTTSHETVTVLDYREDPAAITNHLHRDGAGVPPALDAALDSAIEQSGTEGGRIRLTVFTVEALASATDDATTQSFITATAAALEAVNGMAHFHCRTPLDERSESLASAVGPSIALRRGEDGVEQRWSLPLSQTRERWFGIE